MFASKIRFMNLAASISTLELSLGDPRDGLAPEVFVFVSRITPLINVDLLIQDDRSRTLLTWRDDEFFGAGWHLPGGIIRYKETAADRIRACAREELGADLASDAAPLLVAETIRQQATRGHFISLLFRCRLISPPDPAKQAVTDPPAAGQWRWHQRCPPDLLDVQRPYAPFF
jgi:ADP-ribose pyrophosphatase YjhB (NUDIX family)